MSKKGLAPIGRTRSADLRQPEAPACAMDNRMFPHEWLATRRSYIKTDGTDHHDDHFYPGPQDIAWDLAASKWSSAGPGAGGVPRVEIRGPFG